MARILVSELRGELIRVWHYGSSDTCRRILAESREMWLEIHDVGFRAYLIQRFDFVPIV